MTDRFSQALEAILRRTDASDTRKREAAPNPAEPDTVPDPVSATERRREWFAHFAAETVMPLLSEVARAAEGHGCVATCRLGEKDDRLAADLVIVPERLPRGAKPPRLTVYATEGERPLMVEYTGTFPHVGATGGFGAEIDFEPIFPRQLEERILEFVALATGA